MNHRRGSVTKTYLSSFLYAIYWLYSPVHCRSSYTTFNVQFPTECSQVETFQHRTVFSVHKALPTAGSVLDGWTRVRIKHYYTAQSTAMTVSSDKQRTCQSHSATEYSHRKPCISNIIIFIVVQLWTTPTAGKHRMGPYS